MPDYQTMREENEEVLYLLLTPLRWLIGIAKAAAIILLLIITVTYNQLGWIVGLGHMGYLSRHATADIMIGIPHSLSSAIPPRESCVFSIDLSARQEGEAYRYGPEKVARVAIDPLPHSLPGRVHPPDYCFEQVRRSDPGQAIDGWFNRTRTAYERKGSRMFEAYVTAAISVSYLRTTLTRIKMGMAPERIEAPSVDCEMNPSDALALSPEEYSRWEQVSASIRIPAPTVRMRLISMNGIHDADMWDNPTGLIIGMCLEKECGDGLEPYATMYADLFATKVPLSPMQEHTVDSLNGLATFDYWMKVVSLNGIAGHDAEIRTAYERAMYRIKQSTNPDRVPGTQEWTDFLGFEA
jgi:hypothetical protein